MKFLFFCSVVKSTFLIISPLIYPHYTILYRNYTHEISLNSVFRWLYHMLFLDKSQFLLVKFPIYLA